MLKKTISAGPCVLGTVVAAGLLMLPGTANAGFLDQLFGVAPPPVAAPAPRYVPNPYYVPRQPRAHYLHSVEAPLRLHSRHSAHRVTIAHKDGPAVHKDSGPILQKTTALLDDKTLRPGDAVMMKDGIHVYEGSKTLKHSYRQFVAVDQSRAVTKKERATLVAMDAARFDPLRGARNPDELISHRSVAVDHPVSSGFKITDAKGRSVRYVGP